MTSTDEQYKRYDFVPIGSHWFYSRKNQNQLIWIPFSKIDVENLEHAYGQNIEIVSTNGNRYDVNLITRKHTAVYWSNESNEIRRSKWFYSTSKSTRSIPCDESTDETLENLYFETCNQQSWSTKYEINNGNTTVIFDHPDQILMQCKNNEAYPETKSFSEIRTLKRGLPKHFSDEITTDEKDSIQHLCFVVHGIGAACDMKFRSLFECVEDLRRTSRIILQNHFKSYLDNGNVHRVEFLPIYWHDDLHLDSTGVDKHLLPLTLPSIMKLRTFINTTLADILFYTSPVYGQRIVTRCTCEMNRLYDLFLQRNSSFKGQISVIGHSLGSVILYDILSNQLSEAECHIRKENISPCIQYDKLNFPVAYFFALGSPIAMFLSVRGITSISSDFILPTCQGLFNIFHPCDPIAYRLEPMIDLRWNAPPVLISHHKGRKRIHLELIDKFSKATDLTGKLFGTFRNTMNAITSLVSSNSSIASTEAEFNNNEDLSVNEWINRPIGKLNQGHRIDYVLQHRPIEIINEYLFALSSHVAYWNSEDTMLFILKEILRLDGYESHLPFNTMEQMIKSAIDIFSIQK
ncbi:hypothetical protein I4U23_002786 [Adineta vaga]|nr:hypothetical protein I4U23_002786 [Adineta vaga]